MSSNFENGFGIQLREWELGPNSTKYDNMRAAPSDQEVHTQWIIFITVIVSSLLFQMLVFVAILRDKRCRKNAFNTYILFMMPPDMAFGIFWTMTCALNLASTNGQFFSLASCKFQAFYTVFTVTSSSWLNAIVTYQLHSLLTYSRRAMRYHAPKRKKVAQHAFSVYAWSAFVASWPLWTDQQWWPISPGLYAGSYCLPMAYDTTSLIFFYVAFGPCVFLIPLCYICYAAIDILRKGLLPPREKRQNFMVFVRIGTIYLLIWIPAIAMAFIFGYWLGAWWTFAGGLWGHLQGPISAGVCLLKPDVMSAFKSLICCGEGEEALKDEPAQGSYRSKHKMARRLSSSWIHQSIFDSQEFLKDDDIEISDFDGETPPDFGSRSFAGESVQEDSEKRKKTSDMSGDDEDVSRRVSAVNMAGQIYDSGDESLDMACQVNSLKEHEATSSEMELVVSV